MDCIARTELGDLRGTPHRGVLQFRGVPYAAAPVGELRFGAPRPVEPWDGVRDATEHGPIVPQGPSRLVSVVGDFDRTQSEDSLSLSITTPALDGGARPVIVWLHGGGYSSGSGSLDWYDGATLAAEGDAVVVGVNYRLGPLGYLYYEGLSDGQAGLHDMIAALRWVAAHIAAFGGDPANLTLAGQSAGAHSIMCMLTRADVRPLVRRAILQSAPAGLAPLSIARAIEYGEQFVAALGLAELPRDEVIQALRSAEVSTLLRAAGVVARQNAVLGQVAPPFLPVLDELAAVDDFLEAAAAGAGASEIPLIIGTNRDEARAMLGGNPQADDVPAERVREFLLAATDPDRAELYWHRRPDGSPLEVLSDAVTDVTFTVPSLRLAGSASDAGATVWTYQLDWAPAGSALGACHCLELPLVFDSHDAFVDAPMLKGDRADGLAALIRAKWLNFARHGTPSDVLNWPPYDERRATMLFDAISGAVGDPAGMSWRL